LEALLCKRQVARVEPHPVAVQVHARARS
jgi:hypothetical protein